MNRYLTVVVTVATVMGLVLGGAAGLAFADHTNPPPANETFEATDRIDVWERAVLPLRANTSNAAVTVDNADWRVRDQNDDETSLNRDPVGVFEPGTNVTLAFDLSDAGGSSNFGGIEVELIAAHIEETGEGEAPGSVSEAIDLLSQDDANENASFTAVTNDTLEGGTGDGTFFFEPQNSGVYVFFLATHETGEDGFVISDGNISRIDGNVSIIGVEAIGVRDGEPDVTAPSSVVRGNSADFDVDAAVSDGSVNHLLVLYNRSTFVDSSFVVDLDESPNADFDIANNSTLHSTIDEVNGVARLSEPISVFGIDVNDGTFSGRATMPAIIEFVAESAGADAPRHQDLDTDTTVVLDGSATSANGSGPQTLSVDTFGNWSPGEYQWVYVAVGDSSEVSTAEAGTLSVTEEPTDGDDGDDGGGGGGGGFPPGGGGGAPGDGGGGGQAPPPGEVSPFELNVTALVQNVTVDIDHAPGGRPISIPVPPTDPLDDAGANIDHVNFTLVPPGNHSMLIVPSRGPPQGTPGLGDDQRVEALGYVTIEHSFGAGDAQDVRLRFHVRKAQLDERGHSPDNVRLYRYTDGVWTPLDPEVVGETPSTYVFEAASPGLSVFAIGTAEPAFAVRDTTLDSTEAVPEEIVRVGATIENTGPIRGTFVVELTVEDEVVDQRSVELGPGESTAVEFEQTFAEPGEYAIAVANASVGTVQVEAASTAGPLQPAATPGPPDGTPATGFDLGTVITALIAVVLVLFLVVSTLYLYSRRHG